VAGRRETSREQRTMNRPDLKLPLSDDLAAQSQMIWRNRSFAAAATI